MENKRTKWNKKMEKMKLKKKISKILLITGTTLTIIAIYIEFLLHRSFNGVGDSLFVMFLAFAILWFPFYLIANWCAIKEKQTTFATHWKHHINHDPKGAPYFIAFGASFKIFGLVLIPLIIFAFDSYIIINFLDWIATIIIIIAGILYHQIEYLIIYP